MDSNPHITAAQQIVPLITDRINHAPTCFTIALAGESGCGKSETSKALAEILLQNGIHSLIIGQDNYFYLPPAENDAKRKSDNSWLGPHKEVNMSLLDNTIIAAKNGEKEIFIRNINYHTGDITLLPVSIENIKVIIIEGTYTLLLKNVDARIFIDANYIDTLPYRQLRNRGNEVNDPFVENILKTEHKIIAGHKYLADFIISKDYNVKQVL